MQREVKKLVHNSGIGTKSQQALQLQREQMKTERKHISKKQKEVEKRRLFELKQEIQIASQVAQELAVRRTEMEQKVRQLSPQSIDMDMLEESARALLNMGQENDFVILDTTE